MEKTPIATPGIDCFSNMEGIKPPCARIAVVDTVVGPMSLTGGIDSPTSDGLGGLFLMSWTLDR